MTDLAVELIPCDLCSAAPGQRCLTRTGRRATSYPSAQASQMGRVRAAWGHAGGQSQQDYVERLLGGLANTGGWVRAADVTAALTRTRRWL